MPCKKCNKSVSISVFFKCNTKNFFERFTKHCTKLPRLNNFLELGLDKNIPKRKILMPVLPRYLLSKSGPIAMVKAALEHAT